MHPGILKPETLHHVALLGKQPWAKTFYLAGGTALALHLGHRRSFDLDFFSRTEVAPKKLASHLRLLGNLVIEMEKEGTLWVTLDNDKISFIQYDYPLIDPLQLYEGIHIAGIKDIACMKLDTIANRGSRKDFIDFYFILKEGQHSLEDIFSWFKNKYLGADYNWVHHLKSLIYFEDAEKESDPPMIKKWEWNAIKKYFQELVKKFA